MVLRFLLQDPRFPRAVRHCLGQAEQCIAQLPRAEAPLKIVRQLGSALEKAEPETLDQAALHAYIDTLQLGMAGIHEAIAATWFRHEPRRKALRAVAPASSG
jgi:uncharacterized alpha-E superfamily protein